jgi:hypothetical protein
MEIHFAKKSVSGGSDYLYKLSNDDERLNIGEVVRDDNGYSCSILDAPSGKTVFAFYYSDAEGNEEDALERFNGQLEGYYPGYDHVQFSWEQLSE